MFGGNAGGTNSLGGGASFGANGGASVSGGSTGIGADGGPLTDDDLERLRNAACVGEARATEPLPSVLQLVVDVSGSMGHDAPGGNRSKWAITRDALQDAIDGLPASVGLGVLYYPNRNTNASSPTGTDTDAERPVSACLAADARIPIELLGANDSPHRQMVRQSLDQARPAGGTPTYDAFATALTALRATTLPGGRFMLLITDGQPTFSSGCRGTGNIRDAVDPRPILDLVTAAAGEGLSSFAIGSPGSEEVGIPVFADARTWLSRVASIGGTAAAGCSDDGPGFCHLDMTQTADFATALKDGLETVVGQVLSCSYEVPAPPEGEDLDSVNVVFTATDGSAELVRQAPDGQCSDGWQYGEGRATIELCSATCDRVQGELDPKVELLFGCDTVSMVR